MENSIINKRYCEVILINAQNKEIIPTVYNSFPYNDCPNDEWEALNPENIAQENNALYALLNGPRYWTMDFIYSTNSSDQFKNFGGILMKQQATISPPLISLSYVPKTINRNATFTYNIGTIIYELIDPTNQRWIMQSYSQQIDPNLTIRDLNTLGQKLLLPLGWSFENRILQEPLIIKTNMVLQDNLQNTYSLE
jgi:hypothetical protein